MDQRDLETLLVHQTLARMSDAPNLGMRAGQIERRFGQQIYQAARRQFGGGVDLDAMSCPF
jgi:hypothetical protein